MKDYLDAAITDKTDSSLAEKKQLGYLKSLNGRNFKMS